MVAAMVESVAWHPVTGTLWKKQILRIQLQFNREGHSKRNTSHQITSKRLIHYSRYPIPLTSRGSVKMKLNALQNHHLIRKVGFLAVVEGSVEYSSLLQAFKGDL